MAGAGQGVVGRGGAGWVVGDHAGWWPPEFGLAQLWVWAGQGRAGAAPESALSGCVPALGVANLQPFPPLPVPSLSGEERRVLMDRPGRSKGSRGGLVGTCPRTLGTS